MLDIRLEETLKEWSPDRHFCVTALLFLKKIFYLKSFDESIFPRVPNEEARRLFNSDINAYTAKVTEAVQDSLKRVYEEPSPECTIRFSQPLPAHEVLKQSILRANENASEGPVSEIKGGALQASKNELDISMCDDILTTTESGDAVAQQVPKKLPFYDGANEINEANDQ